MQQILRVLVVSGNTFKEQDKIEQAIGSYRKALKRSPILRDYLA